MEDIEENKPCTELDAIKEERDGSLDHKLLGGNIEPQKDQGGAVYKEKVDFKDQLTGGKE